MIFQMHQRTKTLCTGLEEHQANKVDSCGVVGVLLWHLHTEVEQVEGRNRCVDGVCRSWTGKRACKRPVGCHTFVEHGEPTREEQTTQNHLRV